MRLHQDLRYALRSLSAHPAFAVLVVATMALGIGANVGVFAYLSYLVRPTLAAPQPERLVWCYNQTATNRSGASSYPDFLDLRAASGGVFEQLVGVRFFGASLQGAEETIHSWGSAVSGGYFGLFAARPALGRLLTAADDQPGAPRTVVLSHLTWRRHFAADPGVLGRTLLVDGRYPYEIVGVAEPGFQGTGIWTGIYVPLATAAPVVGGLAARDDRRVITLGRLRPGVETAAAQGVLAGLAAGLDAAYPEAAARSPRLVPVTTAVEGMWGDPSILLAAQVLMAAVAMLLLLAAANVAGLFVARGFRRRREVAVQLALGAGRWRLARRLLLESLTLSVAGGGLGLLLSRGLVRLIEAYLRREVPVGMGDWAAGTTLTLRPGELLAFAAGAAAVAALVCGLAPVLQMARTEIAAALRCDSAALPRRRRLGGRDLLLAVQLALAVVLLTGATLLARTLVHLDAVPLGFEPRGLTLATLFVPRERLEEAPGPAAGRELYQEVLRRTRQLPEVAGAALTWRVPLQSDPSAAVRWPDSGERATLAMNVVSGGSFHTLGVPLLAGRDFDERDGPDAPRVAVLNRSAAERYFPGRSALGRRLELHPGGFEAPGESWEVVGVVADHRSEPPTGEIRPQLYLPFAQSPRPRMTLLVRSRAPLARRLRRLLRDGYPDLAIVDLLPFEEQLDRALADPRMSSELSAGAALLGLLLATFGVFSVASYEVGRRRREIGIRRALGAGRRQLVAWLASRLLRQVALGLAAGLLAALVLGRWLESLLFGVAARDPWTFVAVPAILLAATVLATWLPTRRALGVRPWEALREG